jgi:hypothetical protein
MSRATYHKGAIMGTSKRRAASGKARTERRGADETEPADNAAGSDGLPATNGEAAEHVTGEGRALDFPDLDRTRFAERIEPDEVNGWARQLGVSPERLREAIRVAGDTLEDVRRYLTKPH